MVWCGLAPPRDADTVTDVASRARIRSRRAPASASVRGATDRYPEITSVATPTGIVLIEHGVGARDGEFGDPDGLDRVTEVDHPGERTVANQDVLVVQIVVDHLSGKRSKIDRVVPVKHTLDQPPSAWILDRSPAFA